MEERLYIFIRIYSGEATAPGYPPPPFLVHICFKKSEKSSKKFFFHIRTLRFSPPGKFSEKNRQKGFSFKSEPYPLPFLTELFAPFGHCVGYIRRSIT